MLQQTLYNEHKSTNVLSPCQLHCYTIKRKLVVISLNIKTCTDPENFVSVEVGPDNIFSHQHISQRAMRTSLQ